MRFRSIKLLCQKPPGKKKKVLFIHPAHIHWASTGGQTRRWSPRSSESGVTRELDASAKAKHRTRGTFLRPRAQGRPPRWTYRCEAGETRTSPECQVPAERRRGVRGRPAFQAGRASKKVQGERRPQGRNRHSLTWDALDLQQLDQQQGRDPPALPARPNHAARTAGPGTEPQSDAV